MTPEQIEKKLIEITESLINVKSKIDEYSLTKNMEQTIEASYKSAHSALSEMYWTIARRVILMTRKDTK